MLNRTLYSFVLLLLLENVPLKAAEPLPGANSKPTILTARGSDLLINGKAKFLYGISYYGALGAPEEFVKKDLDEMQQNGFNWIRIWANWGAFNNNVAAVDEFGAGREPFLSKLRQLVADCDRRGMIIDVSLSRGNGITGPPRLQSLPDHRRAVETLVTALRSHRNWYLDLSNERNIKDKRFTSFADLKSLRELARQLSPEMLVTASHSPEITRDELKEYLQNVGVDFITPHRPRDANSAAQTENKTREYLSWMNSMNKIVPVHYQEPFRRGFDKGWNPNAQDFVRDALAARQSGAAGWCLHNGDSRADSDGQPRRSFDLREKRLFDQLDREELAAIAELRRLFRD